MLDELVWSDPLDPRFIYYNKKLQELPMSSQEFFKSELLSCSGKVGAIAGALGYVSSKPKDKEETIKEFVTRHLGICINISPKTKTFLKICLQ